MRAFLKRKIVDPILAFLKQGVTPSKLAWAISLGIVLATMPVFGSGTLLCLLAIWLFRLNPAAVLLVNQLAYPLQFLLYFPFIRAGEWLFDAKPLPLSISQIFSMFANDLGNAMSTLWWSTLYGIVAWILVMIPIAYILYTLLYKIFTKINKSNQQAVELKD
jgi:uncharacterized protein (DUF2062 family)